MASRQVIVADHGSKPIPICTLKSIIEGSGLGVEGLRWRGRGAPARGNIKPGPCTWLGAGSGVRGLGLNDTRAQENCPAQLSIDRGDTSQNQPVSDQLLAQEDAIKQRYGGSLAWEP